MPRDWYYRSGSTTHGPVSAADLKTLAQAGRVRPDDLVRKDGAADWVPAGKVKGLFPDPLPTPPATNTSSPAGAGLPLPALAFEFDEPPIVASPRTRHNRRPPARRMAATLGGGCLAVVLLACAGAAWFGSRPGAGSASSKQRTADARRELLATAEKMEGAMAEAVRAYVEYVEAGEWSWAMMDEAMYSGKFTIETAAAYRKWREAMVASPWRPPAAPEPARVAEKGSAPGPKNRPAPKAPAEPVPPASKEAPKSPTPAPADPPKDTSLPKPRVVAIHKIVFPGNCILTVDGEELARLKDRHPGPFTGTTGHFTDVIGYAYRQEEPGTVPLRRYKVKGGHVFTTKVIDQPGFEEKWMGLWVPAKEGPNASVRLVFKKKDGSMQYGRKSDAAAARKEGYLPTGDEFFMLDKAPE
jgi:hypothetical protein